MKVNLSNCGCAFIYIVFLGCFSLVDIIFAQKITSNQWPKPFDPELDSDKDNIQGTGGKDYPIYSSIPKTSFTCNGKINGFYADMEAQCQSFHLCLNNLKTSFLCGNGTVFNQKLFTCNWWYNTTCKESDKFYSMNSELYKAKEKPTESPKIGKSLSNDNKKVKFEPPVHRPVLGRLSSSVASVPIKSSDQLVANKDRDQVLVGIQQNENNDQNVRQLTNDNMGYTDDGTEDIDEQLDYEQ